MSEVDDLKAMVQDLLQVIREKDEIIERQQTQTAEQQKQIAEQQKQIDALLKENARQAKRIEELEATVAHLEDVNRRLLRRLFGRRTEKTTDPDQALIPLVGLTCDLEFDSAATGEPPKTISARKKSLSVVACSGRSCARTCPLKKYVRNCLPISKSQLMGRP